ncbi:MAG: hypothetical protein ACO3YA_02175 [Candidatus Nanopelagicaceae bacterium]
MELLRSQVIEAGEGASKSYLKALWSMDRDLGTFFFSCAVACLMFSASLPLASSASLFVGGGTACQATVSSQLNVSFEIEEDSRTCTYTFSYSSQGRTITLPENLVSVRVNLVGAKGGIGGPRRNSSGVTTYSSSLSYVGKFSGDIPNPSGKTLEIYTGATGNNGNNNSLAETGYNAGPPGGISSYVEGSGGNGGATGGMPASPQGGTGGSGGAATIVVVDAIPLFAGGGGGTGGTARRSEDNNIAGGAARNSPTATAPNSEGGDGGSYSGSPTNTSCTAAGGGGGGGGGGMYGGLGGAGVFNQCTGSGASSGGYPGTNGSDFPLLNVASTFVQSTTELTGLNGGVVWIELIYKEQSTVNLNPLTSSSLVFGETYALTAATSSAGRVQFSINGKSIKNCKSKRSTSPDFIASCNYRLSSRRPITFKVIFTPDDTLNFLTSSQQSGLYSASRRTGARA